MIQRLFVVLLSSFFALSLVAQENRIKIGIIDTGISQSRYDLKQYMCEGGGADFTGQGLEDTHGHGTNIAWLITRGLNPKKYCIIPLRFYTGRGIFGNLQNELDALQYLIDKHISYLNMSLGGADSNNAEKRLLSQLLTQGVIVTTSAGNEGADLAKSPYYPAAYEFSNHNFHVVGNVDAHNNPTYSTNYGDKVTDWFLGLRQGPEDLKMSGTSQSSAGFLNHYILSNGRNNVVPRPYGPGLERFSY